MMKINVALVLALSACSFAEFTQYFPPKPVGVTTLNSQRIPGVSISYKEACPLSIRYYSYLYAITIAFIWN
jgi:hypothetical protein